MKFKSLLIAASFAGVLVSCENDADNEVERDLNRLDAYLDSVKTGTTEYTAASWDNISREYNNTISRIEKSGEEMSDDAKAKLESARAEYNELKQDFDKRITETRATSDNARLNLRKSLFGDAEVGSDMQFNFVTAKNAAEVYDRFVNTVQKNKDNYSREDWDEIKVLYEALDTRKNEIEKNLATSDNLKIARDKITFASIKSVNRPFTKVDENEAAKQ